MKKFIRITLVAFILIVVASSSAVAMLDQTSPTKYSSGCKSASCAEMLNRVFNKSYSIADLGGNSCKGQSYIQGEINKYNSNVKCDYKSDSYKGSTTELKNKINESMDAGVPIVVAVQRKNSSSLQHHYIIIFSKVGNDYKIGDPWGEKKKS